MTTKRKPRKKKPVEVAEKAVVAADAGTPIRRVDPRTPPQLPRKQPQRAPLSKENQSTLWKAAGVVQHAYNTTGAAMLHCHIDEHGRWVCYPAQSLGKVV